MGTGHVRKCQAWGHVCGRGSGLRQGKIPPLCAGACDAVREAGAAPDGAECREEHAGSRGCQAGLHHGPNAGRETQVCLCGCTPGCALQGAGLHSAAAQAERSALSCADRLSLCQAGMEYEGCHCHFGDAHCGGFGLVFGLDVQAAAGSCSSEALMSHVSATVVHHQWAELMVGCLFEF